MDWREPSSKLKTLIDACKMWWEGDAKEHKCLRMSGIPNHISIAYEIKLDEVEKLEKKRISLIQDINNFAKQIEQVSMPHEKQGHLAQRIIAATSEYFNLGK
jgi:hypothetical protein